MSASSETKVPLHIKAADAATEIFLVDAHFSLRDRAAGELRTSVPPGIYKVRLRAAQTQVDRLIEAPLAGGRPFEPPPVPFVTAMPLEGTAHPNPVHQQIVRDTTVGPAQQKPGAGCRLCLFVRAVSGQETQTAWSGLSIRRSDGAPVAELADGDRSRSTDIMALGLDLDPGTYRVRVSPPRAPAHELFVPLARGWQTQLFTFVHEQPTESGQRPCTPRLTDASIHMAPLGAAFEPGDPSLRLAELLRFGLESGRSVLSEQALAAVLGGDGTDPMLDAFAAHLLIRERNARDHAVEQLIARAGEPIAELPDIAALLLRPGAGTPPKGLRFETPPLLRSSWNLIVAASRRRMSLVPPDSLTAQVGETLVTDPLWLMNGPIDTVASETKEVMSFAEASRLLHRLSQMQPDRLDAERRSSIERVRAEASPLEQSLLNATLVQPDAPKGDGGTRLAYSLSHALKQIQVPSYSIARSMQRLKDKLKL